LRKILLVESIILILLLLFAVGVSVYLSRETDAVPVIQTAPPDTAEPTVPTAPTLPPTEAPAAPPAEELTQPQPTWLILPADRQLTAKQYFLYDCDMAQFMVLSGNQEDKVYPASLTKLYTAEIALKFLDLQQEVTVGSELDLVAWGSSVAKLQKGDVLTVQSLIQALLLPSGNDAAYVLAANAGRVLSADPTLSPASAVAAFVAEMNRQAAEQGMTATHFVNPDGIHDPNHYTSIQDLAILGTLAMKNPVISRTTSLDMVELALSEDRLLTWENTNELLLPDSAYYCPYAVGLKTGNTPANGTCLLSAFQMDGRTILIGVFGCPGKEDRFADTLQLFNSFFGFGDA